MYGYGTRIIYYGNTRAHAYVIYTRAGAHTPGETSAIKTKISGFDTEIYTGGVISDRVCSFSRHTKRGQRQKNIALFRVSNYYRFQRVVGKTRNRRWTKIVASIILSNR